MTLQFLKYLDLPAHLKAGGFDHAAVHTKRNRLYVAHTANDALDVIDCELDQYLYSIGSLTGVAGALVSEENDLLFSSNRGENSVSIFDVRDESQLGKIPVGIRPNGLAYDAQSGLLLAAHVGEAGVQDSTTLMLIDVAQRCVKTTIPVPGRTRWAIFDPINKSFYVNIADPAHIVVVGTERPDGIARTIPIPAAGPHGLDVDTANRRLFCACDAGQLITLDIASGEILNQANLSGLPDVIFFNATLEHLYVAVGNPGVIDVFDTRNMTQLDNVITERDAHTLALDARQNKVYAFLPGTHRAAIYQDFPNS